MGQREEKNTKQIVQIEKEIEVIAGSLDDDLFLIDRKGKLIRLEANKVEILIQEEENWILKIRAV